MRRYHVSTKVVDKMFPDKGREAQRRLLSLHLHLDIGLEADYFIIWSRSLVRFVFSAELIPTGPNDPDVNVYNRGMCPLILGDNDVFQERGREDRQKARRQQSSSVS